MRLNFFNKAINLSTLQSETLKVAVLDALRQANTEQARLGQVDSSDETYLFLQNKIACLTDLLTRLGLTYDH